jgi:hypothetical protein
MICAQLLAYASPSGNIACLVCLAVFLLVILEVIEQGRIVFSLGIVARRQLCFFIHPLAPTKYISEVSVQVISE